MSTNDLYLETFRELMKYDLESLKELAEEEYGVTLSEATKEEIAIQCALIEVDNMVR